MNYPPNKPHFRFASCAEIAQWWWTAVALFAIASNEHNDKHVLLLIILFVWFPNCTFRCWFAFPSADYTPFWLSRSENVPVSTCFSASDSHLTAINIRSSAIKIKLKAQLSLLSIGTRSRLIKLPAFASRIGDFPFADSKSLASRSPTSAVCTARCWSSWLNDFFISTACDLMFTTSNEHRLFTKRSC